jgi:hypothetical protein
MVRLSLFCAWEGTDRELSMRKTEAGRVCVSEWVGKCVRVSGERGSDE